MSTLHVYFSLAVLCEELLPDCSVSKKETRSEGDSSWMCWQHTQQLMDKSVYAMSLTVVHSPCSFSSSPPAKQIAALTACVVTYICTHGPFSYQICLTIWLLRLTQGWCSISLVASASVRLLHMAAACGTVSLHFPKGKRTAHDATTYSIKLQ